MTKEEVDALWFKAMEASIKAEEEFTRYRFVDLVAQREREACARVCDEVASQLDWLTALRCAEVIRARNNA